MAWQGIMIKLYPISIMRRDCGGFLDVPRLLYRCRMYGKAIVYLGSHALIEDRVRSRVAHIGTIHITLVLRMQCIDPTYHYYFSIGA